MSDDEKPVSTVGSNDREHLDMKTLFVRSIPFDATSEQLSDFFSQFCPVKHAVVVTDAEKNSRGFGFVSFSLDEDTKTALEKSRKTKFNNRLLRVDIAKRRDRKDNDASHVKPEKEAIEKRRARLIIRNLPWSVRDPEQLKKIFQKYGAVSDAIIPRKKGGRMSGFAFITMKKNISAENAIKGSQGLKIEGREVAVDFAIEKSKWEAYKKDEEEEEDDSEQEGESDDENEGSEDEESESEGAEIEDVDSDNADVEGGDEDESDIDLDSDEELSDEEEEDKIQRPKQNKKENYAIFVRNIPYDADEDSLKEHFEEFGAVKYALPVMDKETGLAKGTAFVAFWNEESYNACLKDAPDSSSTSMLISDDVSPLYVYQGRILSITPAVTRESASVLTEKNALKRSEALGKAPGERDRRNMYLLNEGRITANSKLASAITPTDMELREKSYKLRVQQLNKNPSLHLSLTRLAIRNLPRAMNAKSLKALGRKAVVSFATEVKDKKRQPLSKEEVNRSIKEKSKLEELGFGDSNRSKKLGVIRQAKVIMEVKGSGDVGRSRGYGFLEYRDHKSALMGLRWLNAHEVSAPEILEGLTDEEKKTVQIDANKKRKLIVEFAIEHANVVKRRREKIIQAKKNGSETGGYKRKREDGEASEDQPEQSPDRRFKRDKKGRNPNKKGNMNKGPKEEKKPQPQNNNKSGLDDNTKKLIGLKRKRRQQKHK